MTDKKLTFRRIAAICVVLLCFVGFLSAAGYYQATNGVNVVSQGDLTPIPAARGEIVDTNGVPLVVNRQSNNLIFKAGLFPSSKQQKERNELILSLIRLLEDKKIKWLDKLPLEFDKNDSIRFSEDRALDIAWLKSKEMLYVNDYATAADCFAALVDRFELKEYKKEDQRKLASVNAELWHQGFRVSAPYTFAQDVPSDLIAQIKEQNEKFPGVDTEIVPVREYAIAGDIMPNILGRVAALDPDEYSRLKSQGYRMNDFIGKSGLEKELENTLRGKDGKKRITLNRDGSLTEEIIEPPVQGNTVVLNIDVSLQKWLMENFADFTENTLKGKRLKYAAGSVIVMNPNTGAVLACVSYPTYDITKFAELLPALDKAESRPLWDRALMAAFPPGSTIKPSVAVTALQEGVITKDSTFFCNGTYTYGGAAFRCPQAGLHPPHVNVTKAITSSCNTFFYNCAVNLGIDKVNTYRSLFGLGQVTGIELPESAGILDSPEYREAHGQEWQAGLTVQSGIAQGDNVFTPIQVANYIATLANGGTRYVPHVVKEIKSYNLSETILTKEPEIAAKIPVSAENMKIVQEAMNKMPKGDVRFGKMPVEIAAKTGTNQRNVEGLKGAVSDGWVMSWAPYEKPEISVMTFVELASGSGVTIPFTTKLYNYYFGRSASFPKPQGENVLLG
ncbi:MAG: hypothetical protein LBJ12_01500 [Oscillospiraceae bacterium]|jgi:penicillin-binding protein 2|nr:hypothetical protein [Oscillospiraceae bacterium]